MSIEDRVSELEKRLQTAEDQLEIIQLISSYAPAVDSGSHQAAADLWVEDGVYDIGGHSRAVGRENIAACVDLDQDPVAKNRGYGHLLSTPRIKLSGDTAEAIVYSFAFVRKQDEYRWEIERAAANHLVLTRTPAGWRIRERFNRLIDGSQISRDVLQRALP